MRSFAAILLIFSALTFPITANAWSARCAIGITDCVKIQDRSVPIDEAERMVSSCMDFTRNNIGRRVVRMSYKQILDISGEKISHPLLRASLAYDYLHDSSLKFDRSIPYEQRYLPVRRACGQVFRDMRRTPPESEE